MRLASLMISLTAVSAGVGCTSYRPAEKIPGIASLTAVSDGVRVEKEPVFQKWADGPAIMKAGDRLSMGEHHAAINLQFAGRAGDRYRFRVESVHVPPGGPIERDVEFVAVPAYGK